MKKLLFSAEGRIGRGTFWKATLGSVFGALAVATLLGYLVIQMGPNEAGPDGGFQVNGLNAVPFFIVVFASLIFIGWSSICLGIKRYHDRDKPGIWVILSLIPVRQHVVFRRDRVPAGHRRPEHLRSGSARPQPRCSRRLLSGGLTQVHASSRTPSPVRRSGANRPSAPAPDRSGAGAVSFDQVCARGSVAVPDGTRSWVPPAI